MVVTVVVMVMVMVVTVMVMVVTVMSPLQDQINNNQLMQDV